MPEEIVSLSLQSPLPTASAIGGIHHVNTLLKEIQARIATIRATPIVPGAYSNAVAQIQAQATAYTQMAQAARAAATAAQAARTAAGGGAGGAGGAIGGRATRGFTPQGFLSNVGVVSGWAIAAVPVYQAFYAAMNLANKSMERFIDIGAQTARLSQVFRGVGGSAQQLTQDVLGLAAANGRSTDEAMEAAIAWSRLGLSRVEVNEAVRVSLMAANVAELSAGEATKHLAALMQVYGFRVDELSDKLGILNDTSNKLNVTNADLLEGLSRSAAVAREAGISYAQLQAMIGVGVSRTGQSGSQMGNAIKSLFTGLGDPALQKKLRSVYGIETASGVGLREGDDVFRDMVIRMRDMSRSKRAALVSDVAGKFQSTRLTALTSPESFVKQIDKAISSLDNLGSAEIENLKIKSSLKKEIEGLSSAWDALITKQGNSRSALLGGQSPMNAMTESVKALKNLVNFQTLMTGLTGGLVDKWAGKDKTGGRAKGLNALGGMIVQPAVTGFNALNEWLDNLANPGKGQNEAMLSRISSLSSQAEKSKLQADKSAILGKPIEKERLEAKSLDLFRQTYNEIDKGIPLLEQQLEALGNSTEKAAERASIERIINGLLIAQEGIARKLKPAWGEVSISNRASALQQSFPDKGEVMEQFERARIGGLGRGGTQAEALQNQMTALDALIAQRQRLNTLDSQSVSTQQMAFREMVALDEKAKLITQRYEMRNKLVQEEFRLVKDLNREFKSSLLTAGPADLLRKLAVSQISDRGPIGTGQFFAFSPEARRDAMQLQPGINPEMQRIRRDRAALGPEEGDDQLAEMFDKIRERMNKLAEHITTGPDVINAAARNAAGSLDLLSNTIFGSVIPAMKDMAAMAKGLIGNEERNAPGAMHPIDEADDGRWNVVERG